MSEDLMSDHSPLADRESPPPAAAAMRAAPSDEFPDLGFGSPPQAAPSAADQMDLSRSQESISEAVLGQQQSQQQHQSQHQPDLGEGQNRWMDQAVAGAIAAVPRMASRVAAVAGFAAVSASAAAAPASVPAQPPQPQQPPPVVILPLEFPAMRELPPIKLGRTPKERTLYEQLGDLYSLLVTTEHIETAYVRDAISEQAYTGVCSKLIAQYKTLRESMGEHAPELESFCKEYALECRAAENRFRVGIPATVVHGDSSSHSLGGHGGHGQSGSHNSGNKLEVAVFHAVQHFITTMDSLKLNLRAVDEIHPTLSELMDSVNKVPNLPQGHESKTKVLQWLTTLHGMKAHEELTDEQARQMSFDLDSAYNSFHRFVKGQ